MLVALGEISVWQEYLQASTCHASLSFCCCISSCQLLVLLFGSFIDGSALNWRMNRFHMLAAELTGITGYTDARWKSDSFVLSGVPFLFMSRSLTCEVLSLW